MTATLNASTANGVILTSDTSGNLAIQSNGTTIATAQSSGLTISSYTAGASLITSGTAQASTSGTSIDFTGIPSWVKRITVMFNGVSTNGVSVVQVQLGSGSPTTSGYLASATGALNGYSPLVTNPTTGFQIIADGSAGYVRSGTLVCTLVGSNIWVAAGNGNDSASARFWLCGGSVSLSGTLDRIRITTVNGTDTFDAGSINILYE